MTTSPEPAQPEINDDGLPEFHDIEVRENRHFPGEVCADCGNHLEEWEFDVKVGDHQAWTYGFCRRSCYDSFWRCR